MVIGICITLTGCGREGDRAPSEQKVTAPSLKSARVTVSPTTSYNPLENTETAVAGTPSLLAASNDRRVPGVVGRKASKACQILRRDGYGGGVFAVRGNDGLGRGRIVAQDPPSGSKGSEGQLVHLIVSAPFDPERFPRDSNCVDRTDLGLEQFPTD